MLSGCCANAAAGATINPSHNANIVHLFIAGSLFLVWMAPC